MADATVGNNWLDQSVTAVLQSILANVKKYDEATLTWEELSTRVKADVELTITKAYDHGFEHGVTAQVEDLEDETDDMQLEFDLDELREIGEEEENAE